MHSQRQQLFNFSEELTYEELQKVAKENNVSVHSKVRLADVLKISKSGISSSEYTYALQAHFDFTIFDNDHRPQFSIEFDGPCHESQEGLKKDKLKNRICQHFDYPLLRINIYHIDNNSYKNNITLLAWIIDVYYCELYFYQAQEKGIVPPDEIFDPFLILAKPTDNKVTFPYWISHDARCKVIKLAENGEIVHSGSNGLIGCDTEGNLRGIIAI